MMSTIMDIDGKSKEELIEDITLLKRRVACLEKLKNENERMEYELEVRTFELDLRLKELYCLLNISKLVDDHSLTLEHVIEGIIKIVPTGWQYPEITYCRAVVDDKEYKTENFLDTEWKESCEIMVNSRIIGFLDVGYLEKTPQIDGSYFLDEERRMLSALAEQIERIIERKKNEEQLKYYATVDTMTGTLNRRTGLALLEEQMKLMQRKKEYLSICFIDADNLKYVNDTFSHEEGDDLIIIVTDILRSSIRKSDTLCRLGGDEFLIILPECREEQAQEVWQKIETKLEVFNQNEEKPYRISVSHGCSEFHWDSRVVPDILLADADKKMYLEKEKYRAGLR